MCVDCLSCTIYTPEVGKSVWKCIYLNRSAFVCARIVLRYANEQTTRTRTKWEIQFCVVSRNIRSFIETRPAAAQRWLQTRLLLSWSYFNFSSLRLLFLPSIFKAEWMRVEKKNAWIDFFFRGENPTTTHQLLRQRRPQSVRQEEQDADRNRFTASHAFFLFLLTFLHSLKSARVWYNSGFNRRNDKHTFFHEARNAIFLFCSIHSSIPSPALAFCMSNRFVSVLAARGTLTPIRSPCR